MCTLFSTSIFYGPVVTTIRRRDGYKGIFGEEGVDTGAYLGGYHGFRVWKCKKMYFLHTRTSWDKHMFNGMPNSNFKIGLSLFGCAEKYTEQSTHCAVWMRRWVFKWSTLPNDLLNSLLFTFTVYHILIILPHMLSETTRFCTCVITFCVLSVSRVNKEWDHQAVSIVSVLLQLQVDSDSEEKMGDELTILLEAFHKIEKAGGQATLSLSTSSGKTKVKLGTSTTAAPPSVSPSQPASSTPGRRHRRRGAWARARRNLRAAAHQASLA